MTVWASSAHGMGQKKNRWRRCTYMVKPLGRIGDHDTHWYVAWRRYSMLRNSKSAGRCTYMVKPPVFFFFLGFFPLDGASAWFEGGGTWKKKVSESGILPCFSALFWQEFSNLPCFTTAQTLMMKRSIVGLDSERFKHGGKHVKIGWHATKRTVNRSSMTSRSCWRHYLTRK